MWPNPQFPADLVTFSEEIFNGKLHFFVQCIIGLIAKIPRKFINNSRYKFFGYMIFKSERIGKLDLTFKWFLVLQQFKIPLNVCCNLFLICKVITPKYGRAKNEHFFSTAGAFSLTRSKSSRNFLQNLSVKFSR